MSLTEHQEEIVSNAQSLLKTNDIILISGKAGTGKRHINTEPILTPEGFVPMGEITVGCKVMCPVTGKAKNVIATYPQKDEFYKITFCDGTTSICSLDHLWKVRQWNSYKVMSLKEMLDIGLMRRAGKKRMRYSFRVPLTNPIHFEEKSQSIHPYILGTLLGDGSMPEDSIAFITTYSIDAKETYARLKEFDTHNWISDNFGNVDKYNPNCRRIYFKKQINFHLKELGLLGIKSPNRFIPYKYLHGSVKQRKLLLAGLLDTDGSCIDCKTRKRVSYSTTSTTLKDDFVYLVRSLGGYVTVQTDKRKNKYSSDVCYKINVRLPFNPFLKKRKSEVFEKYPHKKKFEKAIINVEFYKEADGQCITVDSVDHLYLCNDFTVTHNTYSVNELIKRLPKKGGKQIFCTAPTHKAVQVLREKVKGVSVEFTTIHSALNLKRTFKKNGEQAFIPSGKSSSLTDCGYLIVDEASMIGEDILSYIEDESKRNKFKVLFIGDYRQLNPVNEENSPVFQRDYPLLELTEIIRQKGENPIITLASDLSLINSGEEKVLDKKGYTYTYDGLRIINALAKVNGTDELKYVAYTNVEVDMMNTAVRKKIYGNPKKIEKGESIVLSAPFRDAYVNNQELIIQRVEETESNFFFPEKFDASKKKYEYMEVKLKHYMCQVQGNSLPLLILHEKDEEKFDKICKKLKQKAIYGEIGWVDYYSTLETFAQFKYNHAISTHKSQGSTYKKVIINIRDLNKCKNPEEKQRLLYTAVTRASDLVILYNV